MKRIYGFSMLLLVAAMVGAASGDLADVVDSAAGRCPGERRGGFAPPPFTIPLDTNAYWSAPPYGGSAWGVGLTDLSADGYPEVAIVYEQGYCYVYKNSGGVIESVPSWTSSDQAFNIWPAFGDVDNDGDLDMAVACYSFVGGRTKVYHNVGGGLEPTPGWVAQSGGGTICDWGDYDNDGDLDLAIADMFANPGVFRNDSGTLTSAPAWRGLDFNIDYAAAWLDVDNDGDLDLAVTGINASIPALRIYKNDAGTLETSASWRSTVTGGEYLGSYVCPWDVNRDGWIDAAVSTGFINSQPNVVFINRGGTLEGSPSWVSRNAAKSGGSLFGDLNGDGRADWAVNDGDYGSVYERLGDTLNPTPGWRSHESGGLGIDLGDVDRDAVEWREDTVVSTGRGLFYLSRLPIERFEAVTVDGDTLPLADYCVNPKRGWVSIRDSVPTGAELVFGYWFSTDLELLLSDYPGDRAHLFRSNQVGLSAGGPPGPSVRPRAWPNPFVDAVEIDGAPAPGTGSSIRIYDARGGLVRDLSGPAASGGRSGPDGRLRMRWDGRDTRGRPVPPGVYVVLLGDDSRLTAERLVRMR